MNVLEKIEELFVGIMIMATTAVLFVNIILRNLLDANTTWAEEFVRYGMIWIAFIGSAICFRHGIHFGVDLLIKSLPKKHRPKFQVYINLVCILFVALLIYFGFRLVFFSIETGQITPSLQIGVFWVYLSIPIGGLLSLIHLVIDTGDLIRHNNHNVEGERE